MSTLYAEPVLAWYARHARDLPWRAPGATPWSVLVSEIMLQQTPVPRVRPEYLRWIARWPTPAALAAEPAGEAIRQWGRLGYPRRALRLHETATILTARHGGQVPADRDALLALPGIGSYTAAAVASFAFGQRHAVLDTNVRRVLARLVGPAQSRRRALGGGAAAGRIAAARRARGRGPLVGRGDGTGRAGLHGRQPALRYLPGGRGLRLAGRGSPRGAQESREPAEAARRRTQRYDGTDRQCRGRLLAVLRDSGVPVSRADFDAVWSGQAQLARALDGLIADGLADPLPDGRFALPGSAGLKPTSCNRQRETNI